MAEIWFGTMPFGSQVDENLARGMVKACLDRGITRFDTADAYNWGGSEEILGKCLAGMIGAEISTKVGAQYGAAPVESGLKPEWIRKSIEGSLTRLGIEAVEIYYMHQPDPGTPIEETIHEFDKLQQEGKIHRVGTSNFAAWQVMELYSRGLPAPVAQQMYSPVTRSIEDEWMPFAEKYEVTTLAYNPLAGGLLTGKHRGQDLPAEGTRFYSNDMYMRRFWSADMFRAVEKLAVIAERAERTLVQLSLQWAKAKADGILIGATTMEQLMENLDALEGDLDGVTLKACDEVWSDLRGPIPKYNR